MNEPRTIVEVALPVYVHKTFHYSLPDGLKGKVALGQKVLVPFGSRTATGYVVGFPSRPAVSELKEVKEILEQEPSIAGDILELCRWAASYYFSPLGEVLQGAVPEGPPPASRKVAVLTEKGRQLMETTEEPELRALLRQVDQGKLSALMLEQRKGLKRQLARLERVMLITYEQRLSGRQMKPGMLILYRAKEELGGKPLRSARQKSLLALVRELGLASLQRLKEEDKGAAPRLKALVQIGLIERVVLPRVRTPVARDLGRAGPRVLNEEQELVLAKIVQGVEKGQFHSYLLHGVTGSGKTEVYLAGIRHCLEKGKGAILLVPEIGLTWQVYSLARRYLGEEVALLHSGLSNRERYDQWRLLKEGRARVALGARSAIFAPIKSLGLIVVDEEHDQSYKQEERFPYNARDLALVRGKQAQAVVLLGSATPSLESFFNTHRKKGVALFLRKRVEARPLPSVEIVDMRQARSDRKGSRERVILSQPLLMAMERHLGSGRQIMLFLNRRGEATFVLCPDCGYVYRCPSCFVALVSHRKGMELRCHWCNFNMQPSLTCPHCKGMRIRAFGLGCQQLENHVKALFPLTRVARADSDVAEKKGALEAIFTSFYNKELDILVGTQMIAKGLDFPGVGLIGVVAADSSLNFPDFRAGERTFQLLTQVAGRAGRSGPGEVVIQTYNPEHYAIQWAARHDFLGFYQEEVKFRRELNYPPYCRLIKLELSSAKEEAAQEAAHQWKEVISKLADSSPGEEGLQLVGPAPAPLYRLKGRYRWQLYLKGQRPASLHSLLAEAWKVAPRSWSVSVSVDVDPLSVL